MVLGSCSLQGLDRFEFPHCTAGAADRVAGCAALNSRDGIDVTTACQVWQCNATGDCSFGVLDADGDTHGALRCGGDDCADRDRNVYPGLAESCDGADNDCNGVVDDVGAGATGVAPVAVIDEVATVTFASFADREDGVLVLWSDGTTARAGLVAAPMLAATSAIDGVTNAQPFVPLSSTTVAGCPTGSNFMPFDRLCGTPEMCPGSQVCVDRLSDGARICEQPVVPRGTGRPPLAGPVCTTHNGCSDGLFCNGAETCEPNAADTQIDERGCRAAAGRGCSTEQLCVEETDSCVDPGNERCDFDLLSASSCAVGDEFFTLAVSDSSCALVRPGLLDMGAAMPSVSLIGGYAYSTTWRGLTSDPSDFCTAMDVTGPAIAGLPVDFANGRVFPTAIAAYRAAPDDASSASIGVIGLWRESLSIDTEPFLTVNGSDDGHPVMLSTPSRGRPHVATFASGASAGYVVVAPRDGGGIAVAAFPALGTPECASDRYPTCMFPRVPGPDMVFGTADDPPARTSVLLTTPAPTDSGGADAGPPPMTVPSAELRRTSPSLGAPVETTVASSEPAMPEVLVATGIGRSAQAIDLALAWSTATEVVIQIASIDPSTRIVTTSDAALRIPAAGATALSMAHVEAGISLEGRFGATTIPAGETGGYVLTWVAGGITWGARVSDHTRMMVGTPVRIGTESVGPFPFVDYDDANNPRVRVIARQGTQFVVFPSVCGPTS